LDDDVFRGELDVSVLGVPAAVIEIAGVSRDRPAFGLVATEGFESAE